MKSDDVILSQKKWEQMYRQEAWSNNNNYQKDPTILAYKRFLEKYKEKFSNGVFLDLGCGVAWTSALLARKGVSILGIDISSEAISKSKALFKKEKLKGKFLQANLLNLPLKNESVSFIYSCMSLEYVRDTQKAVNEACRVLKRKGTIVAILPVISLTTLSYHQLRGDIPNLPMLRPLMEWLHINVLKGKYMHYGYEQSFTPALLQKVFTHSGFIVKNIAYFDGYYPIAFVPLIIRPYMQRLLKYRLFWPLVYIEAIKN